LFGLYPHIDAIWLIPAMAALGLMDDFFPQPAALRLLLQLALALLAVIDMGDLGIHGATIAVRALLAVTLVGFVNLANFFDGRNGLLSGTFIVVLLFSPLLGVQHQLAWIVAGLWLGYLPFNFPRAKVFMGDVGSYCIGATLGLIFLQMIYTSSVLALAFVWSCLGLLLDPVLTLLTRACAGKAVWRAHREHLYQYLSRVGVSDAKLLGAYALYTALSACVVAACLRYSVDYLWSAFIAWGLVSTWLWFYIRRQVLKYARKRRK
jgi:UDP-N-acetylmuramyl pentapeptide phosphotransferase/UDP-N-acetylglucosamine-1-phosphate transferase